MTDTRPRVGDRVRAVHTKRTTVIEGEVTKAEREFVTVDGRYVLTFDYWDIEIVPPPVPAPPELPLPGESIVGGIVIASVWINDEVEEPVALLLLLRSEPDYYELGDITWKNGAWVLYSRREHANIVPAVEDYRESGGDY